MLLVVSTVKANFKTDEIFHDEVLEIMCRYKNMVSLNLLNEDDELVASVPVYLDGKEYVFPSSLFSFVDSQWFTDDVRMLRELQCEVWKHNYDIDIVGLTEGFKQDVGVGLVPCVRRQEFASKFDTKMQKKLRQAEKHYQGMIYTDTRVWAIEDMIRDWFKRYDNPDVDLVLDLYRYWEHNGLLKAMAVIKGRDVVACDILLLQGGKLCGLLTPWNKDDDKLKKLWIGWFVIVMASDYGKQLGLKWFSIGDTMLDYKKKFVTQIMPTYYIGLGRREFRDEQKCR